MSTPLHIGRQVTGSCPTEDDRKGPKCSRGCSRELVLQCHARHSVICQLMERKITPLKTHSERLTNTFLMQGTSQHEQREFLARNVTSSMVQCSNQITKGELVSGLCPKGRHELPSNKVKYSCHPAIHESLFPHFVM